MPLFEEYNASVATEHVKFGIGQPSSEWIKQKLFIVGETGRLGSLVKKYMNDDFEYVGGGGRDSYLQIKKTNPDIVIDVSNYSTTVKLMNYLLENNLKPAVLVGTTSDEHMPEDKFEEYAKVAPFAWKTNFSHGVPEMLNLYQDLHNDLDKGFHETQHENHHVHKKDESCTAKTLAQNLSPKLEITSERKGEILGVHQYTVSNNMEEITVSHVTKQRDLFAKGAIFWANFLAHHKPGDYSNYSNIINFDKYSACGKDFIITQHTHLTSKQIKNLCDRNNGIGADGMICVFKKNKQNIWRHYNKNGEQSDFCGIGLQTVIHYLYNKTNKNIIVVFDDHNNRYNGTINDSNMVCVNIPKIEMIGGSISDTIKYRCGVDHLIAKYSRCDELIKSIVKDENANFTQYVQDGLNVKIKTFEKGVFDFTKSCGFAAACVWYNLGCNKYRKIITDGGILKFTKIDDVIFMTGPVKKVFNGYFTIE
jgi:diaminopimelate epimerase